MRHSTFIQRKTVTTAHTKTFYSRLVLDLICKILPVLLFLAYFLWRKMTLKGLNICLSEDFGQARENFHAYIRSEKQFVVEHVRYIVRKGPDPTQGIDMHTFFRSELCCKMQIIWVPLELRWRLNESLINVYSPAQCPGGPVVNSYLHFERQSCKCITFF